MDEITLKALAKINLGLDVVRRREDGYHEVRMIMQTIHLYDRLNIRKIEGNDIKIKTNLAFLPVNVLICCFQIKDIFLTIGVLYAFYIFLMLKNSRKVKAHQIIICVLLLWGVYYTRGGVVEMLVIFLLVYVL